MNLLQPSYKEILAVSDHPLTADSLSGSTKEVPKYLDQQIEQARQKLLTRSNQEKQTPFKIDRKIREKRKLLALQYKIQQNLK